VGKDPKENGEVDTEGKYKRVEANAEVVAF
jgi:hypothetical protein